jgi:DNA-binding CsgD family transcriptional regulator
VRSILGVRAEWPFVGRLAELDLIRNAVVSGVGMVIAGPAGVGKTRMAAEVFSGLRGYSTVRATGTEAAAVIPFGAFALELPQQFPAFDGHRNLLRWAAERLRDGRNEQLLLLIDDAHLLDPPSAALVHHLVVQGVAKVLLTFRAGESAPDPVTALWRDGLVPRLDMQALDLGQTDQLLAGVLGAFVQGATVSRLWDVSRGNLLYLKELVMGGVASGALTIVDETWSWVGPFTVSPSMRDLINARIGALDEDERYVLELVALGEPIGAHLLATLASSDAVDRLERRSLVIAQRAGRRLEVRTAHPLYGELVREQCGPLRTRLLRTHLAATTESVGQRRRDDILRVAVWRLDSGTARCVESLMAAAVVAWSSYDIGLGVRLYRAALDAGGGEAAAGPLSFLLFHLGRSSEAVAVLCGVRDEVRTDEGRALYVQSLAINLSCGLGRYDEACRAIDEAEAAINDRGSHQDVLTTRGVVDFFAGRMAGALRAVADARALGPMSTRVEAQADAIEAWTCAHQADTERSLTLVKATLDGEETWKDHAGYIRPTLLDAQCNAHLFAGDLTAAEASADKGLELAGQWANWEMAYAGFSTYRAQAARMRGRALDAFRYCREAVGRQHGWNTNVPRLLSELGHAAALIGRADIAASAMARAQYVHGPGLGNWAMAVAANAPWLTVATGDVTGAVAQLLSVAERAGELELFGYRLLALHDVVRLGTAVKVLGDFDGLLAHADGAFAPICARHAVAAAGHDGDGLVAVSAQFEGLEMNLYAAEAAAQAAAAFRVLGMPARASAAQARATMLWQRCPHVRTPALYNLLAPDLTGRQIQVAQLAASGLSNRQIADQLVVSVRTIENHLGEVYRKLGINDRTQLFELFGTATSSAGRRSQALHGKPDDSYTRPIHACSDLGKHACACR